MRNPFRKHKYKKNNYYVKNGVVIFREVEKQCEERFREDHE